MTHSHMNRLVGAFCSFLLSRMWRMFGMGVVAFVATVSALSGIINTGIQRIQVRSLCLLRVHVLFFVFVWATHLPHVALPSVTAQQAFSTSWFCVVALLFVTAVSQLASREGTYSRFSPTVFPVYKVCLALGLDPSRRSMTRALVFFVFFSSCPV